MKITELIDRVEATQAFGQWRAANKDAYLASAFAIFDADKQPGEWSIGYFNPGTDKMTVFVVNGDVRVCAPSDVFKSEEGVKAITREKVGIDFKDALRIAKEFQEKNYSADQPQRVILILQQLIAQVWNISIITNTCKMLNIRINSESGKVLHSSITPLFRFVEDGSIKD